MNKEKIRLVKGKMPKAQKIRFLEYAIRKLERWGEGMCGIYNDYFSTYPDDFKLIPELRQYKPKVTFYTFDGGLTEFTDQFWFPVNDSKSRIEICNKIIKELKS